MYKWVTCGTYDKLSNRPAANYERRVPETIVD